MNYSQLKNEICVEIDFILACYWSTPGAGQMPKPVQRQGGASAGFEQGNYRKHARRRERIRAFRDNALRFVQRQSASCDPAIMNIAFSRAADRTAGLGKFGR